MNYRALVALSFFMPMWAQHPSLEGIWNSASLTPFQRPVELGNKEFYTEQEAAVYEKSKAQEVNRDRRDGGQEADVARAYNELFFDRGTKLARTRRTSMIFDPPNARNSKRSKRGLQRTRRMDLRTDRFPTAA